MGTLWISRMASYSNHPYARASAEHIIRAKVASQYRLIKKHVPAYHAPKNKNDLLLFEARMATQYWKHYRALLPLWSCFRTRRAHIDSPDIVNQLLDIGYHYLKDKVVDVLRRHDISSAIGLLHIAKTDKSMPLVYDLMELFRTDVVDREVLHYLRLKKQPLQNPSQRDIAHFLSRVKRRIERRVYLKDFKQCHTYRYAMEVQILHFIKAVNHGEIFHPVHLPTRHDGRCKRC